MGTQLFRTQQLIVIFSALGSLAAPAMAQKSSAPAPPSSSNSTSNSTPLGANRSTRNNTLSNSPDSLSQNQNVILLSGSVLFDDGSKPTVDVVIERICSGTRRPEAHTDNKGRFSFRLGENSLAFSDASVSAGYDPAGSQANSRFASAEGSTGSGGRNSSLYNSLLGCELQASYPGYRSDSVNLSQRHSLDDPNVGTIVLHRLANVSGTTISLTSALAPRQAIKDYDKAMQLTRKGKSEEAEKHLQAAVAEYPKYAVAWYELGLLQQAETHVAEARTSFGNAIQADAKFVSPYDRLAMMALQDGHWQEAADFSKQEIALNPVEFPSAFLYNSLANLNLKKLPEAEKSAREVLKLDTGHHYPQGETLLAQTLMEQGKLADAAIHLRAYLALAPNAKDADRLKQQLLKIEQASAARN